MLRLAKVFGAHMVLQRDKEIAVFGEADGEVTVTLAGKSAKAQSVNGRFTARLPRMAAGGPHTMTVRCGAQTLTVKDVMIGEVWLCGGQSNMEFRLRDERDYAIVNSFTDPRVRFFEQPQAATTEQAEELEAGARWVRLEAGRCADVSAVAFYAGMEMASKLDVPVGMIICCIGGTSASAWMSREHLATFPEGQAYIDEFEQNVGDKTDEQFDIENAAYMKRVDEYGKAQDALKRKNPAITWAQITASIGDFPWPPPFGRKMLRRPGGPYETMLMRLAPYTLRGILYYQGEEDAPMRRAEGYRALFGHLIASWRALFEDETLPFIAAQLPAYGADPALDDWPTIRAAQQQATDEAGNAALACLIDCGERDNIHPVDKRTPGRRIAALALNRAYGLDVRAQAPRVTGVRMEGDRLYITCSNTGGVLAARGDLRDALTMDGARLADIWVSGESIVLTLDGRGGDPVRVRYAQDNWPCVVFFGQSGLPLFPFDVTVQ